jgi:hypothetical protein
MPSSISACTDVCVRRLSNQMEPVPSVQFANLKCVAESAYTGVIRSSELNANKMQTANKATAIQIVIVHIA